MILVGESKYNKLVARKIGPMEIIEMINSNAYQLKLPSHIKMFDVFNVKHLVLFTGDTSNEDVNLRENSLQHEDDDVEEGGSSL